MQCVPEECAFANGKVHTIQIPTHPSHSSAPVAGALIGLRCLTPIHTHKTYSAQDLGIEDGNFRARVIRRPPKMRKAIERTRKKANFYFHRPFRLVTIFLLNGCTHYWHLFHSNTHKRTVRESRANGFCLSKYLYRRVFICRRLRRAARPL